MYNLMMNVMALEWNEYNQALLILKRYVYEQNVFWPTL